MGEILRSEHLIPEAIISSMAARARATTEAVAKASGYKGKITLNSSLYAAGPEAYLKVLHGLSNSDKRGHVLRVRCSC
jgi:phosphohistidine phosphatase SixA